MSERDEPLRDRAFRERIVSIWNELVAIRRPNGKPLSPFFFGQRLRRLVREAIEAFETEGK